MGVNKPNKEPEAIVCGNVMYKTVVDSGTRKVKVLSRTYRKRQWSRFTVIVDLGASLAQQRRRTLIENQLQTMLRGTRT